MANIIPHRKPGTPLNEFYALGKYNGRFSKSIEKTAISKAGLSATLNERNSNNVQEVPIKPQIHEKLDK